MSEAVVCKVTETGGVFFHHKIFHAFQNTFSKLLRLSLISRKAIREKALFMKNYFVAIFFVAVLSSAVLHFSFYYPVSVLLYHLLLIGGFCAGIFTVYYVLGYIPNRVLRSLLQHVVCFSFFLSLCIFYLVTLGSNEFWGKAMELNLLVGYIFRLNTLIETLPVDQWILYAFLIVFLCIVFLAYYFVRPESRHNSINNLRRDLIVGSIIVLLMIVFFKPALLFKRYMYAAGEPVLEFIYPKTWHDQKEMMIYENVLMKDVSKDRACVESVEKEPVHKADRNVIIILVDDWRREFLSAYGYHRPTTPFLDSMLRTGTLIRIRFPFSPSTATVSGVANLFASKNISDFSFAGLRLGKYMKFKNYHTYALVTGQHSNWYWLPKIYKNDCDFFFESKSDLSPGEDDFVTLEKIESTSFKEPFFAYVHLMSAHIMGKKQEEFKKYLPDKIGLSNDKKEALINNYDNGILQVDHVIKKIFDKFRKDGQLEHSTIFILSDHGELFGKDGRWKHAGSLHPDLQSIPMFIYDQDKSWYQNTYAATLLDIAPTIADRLGYDIPECWDGVSLHDTLRNFKIAFESGVASDLPHGMLINKDSILTLDIFDQHHLLKEQYKLSNKSKNWIKVPVP